MSKKELDYPLIPDILIKCLSRDYPDVLPRGEKSPYEMGVLVGQQMVIDKLKFLAENGSE